MQFITDNNIKVQIIKCKRPRSIIGIYDPGRILINGILTDMFVNTDKGDYAYFQHGENYQWYKFRMYNNNIDELKGKSYDIDPYDNIPQSLQLI